MNGNQQHTPLFTQLQTYSQAQHIPFHIPGHKKGHGMDPEFREFLGHQVLASDLINIPPLDNLHQPTHILQAAQKLAAEAFGADYSFFSVQGTTGSIFTMMLATCQPHDKLILPRNIHQSIVSAIILAGIRPVFLPPTTTSYLTIEDVPTASHIRQTLEQHPDSRAVLLVHPTYAGQATELRAIVDCVHTADLPVLVDEAHGALGYFHPELPISAMAASADLAATSIHKTGGSLIQTSMLHLQGSRIQPEQIQRAASMLTTTSTSYLLLASLDAARRQLALYGREMATQLLELSAYTHQQITQIPYLSTRKTADPSRLIIQLDELSISGHAAADWLREKHRIEVELSDTRYVLCLLTIGDTEASVTQLLAALTDLAQTFASPNRLPTVQTNELPLPTLAMRPRDAHYAKTRSVHLLQTAGEICAQTLMSYPPGVPILLPGEVIAPAHIAYITALHQQGQTVQGLDASEPYIHVVA